MKRIATYIAILTVALGVSLSLKPFIGGLGRRIADDEVASSLNDPDNQIPNGPEDGQSLNDLGEPFTPGDVKQIAYEDELQTLEDNYHQTKTDQAARDLTNLILNRPQEVSDEVRPFLSLYKKSLAKETLTSGHARTNTYAHKIADDLIQWLKERK